MNFKRTKRQITRIAATAVSFVFLFSAAAPRQAFAGNARSSAHLDSPGGFSFSDFGRSAAIGIGCAAVGSAVGTLITSGGSFAAAGTAFTNSFSSLGNIAAGYNTYMACAQVGRAVGNIGTYQQWDPSVTFAVSTIATSATAGFLNPEISLAKETATPAQIQATPELAYQAPIAPEANFGTMMRGAAVGAMGGAASAGAIYTVDHERIDKGQAPGVVAQIAGTVAGVAGTELGRTLMTPQYPTVAVIDSTTNKADPAVAAKRIMDNPSDANIHAVMDDVFADSDAFVKNMEAKYPGTFDASYKLQTEVNQAIPNSNAPKIDMPNLGTYGGGFNYDSSSSRNTFVSSEPSGTVTPPSKVYYKEIAGRSINGRTDVKEVYTPQEFDQKVLHVGDPNYDAIKIEAAGTTVEVPRMNVGRSVDNTFEVVDYGGKLSAGEYAGRMAQAVVVKPFSGDNLSGSASQAVGIVAADALPKNKEYLAPLVRSAAGGASGVVFSAVENLYPVSLDLYAGTANDKNMARAEYKYGVELMAKNYRQENFAKAIDKPSDQVNADIAAGKNPKEVIQEFAKDAQALSIDTDKEFIYTDDPTNKEAVEKAIAKATAPEATGVYSKDKERRDTIYVENLNAASQPLGDTNANMFVNNEGNRIENRMKDKTLGDALDAAGVNRGEILASAIYNGVRSVPLSQNVLSSAAQVVMDKNFAKKSDSQKMLISYGANMAGAVLRGAAMWAGWDHTTHDWEWKDQVDWVKPEAPQRVKESGEKMSELDYRIASNQYAQDELTYERYLPATRITPIIHPEYKEWNAEDGKYVPESREVASVRYKNDVKPSLAYHIGESILQANTDYATTTFTFDRPLVRNNGRGEIVGIPAQNISPSDFMNYVGQLQQMTPSVSKTLVSQSLEGNASGMAKSGASSVIQFEPARVAFNMQPERLVYTEGVREVETPAEKITGEIKIANNNSQTTENIVAVDSMFGHALQDNWLNTTPTDAGKTHEAYNSTYNSNSWDERKAAEPGASIVAADSDDLGIHTATVTTADGSATFNYNEEYHKGSLPEGAQISVQPRVDNSMSYLPAYVSDMPKSAIGYTDQFEKANFREEVLKDGEKVLGNPVFVPNGAPNSYEVGNTPDSSGTQISEKYTVQPGTSVFYLSDNTPLPMLPSTIQRIQYTGPAAVNTVYYAPYPNALYSPKAQTGNMEYLKNNQAKKVPPQPMAVPK